LKDKEIKMSGFEDVDLTGIWECFSGKDKVLYVLFISCALLRNDTILF
jgi:hypothetical protein